MNFRPRFLSSSPPSSFQGVDLIEVGGAGVRLQCGLQVCPGGSQESYSLEGFHVMACHVHSAGVRLHARSRTLLASVCGVDRSSSDIL
jgi:hypothetical protein